MALLFPKYSTNLVIGASGCGKSKLLEHFLSNPLFYFEKEPSNIYIVLCNNQTPNYNLVSSSTTIVHQLLFEEFDLNLVEPESIVVFEDVNVVYESIKVACNVQSHHLPLLALFIVSQNIVGNNHFELVKLCHRCLFCTKGSAYSAHFILRTFIKDLEVKKYLEKVLNFVEKLGNYLLLEINSIAARPSNFKAFSHFDSTKFYLGYSTRPIQDLPNFEIKQKYIMELSPIENLQDVPPNTFAILPLHAVQEQIKDKNKDSLSSCANEKTWKAVLDNIYSVVEQDLPLKRWKICKAVARNLFECKHFCVTIDARFVSLKSKPSERAVLIDFISDVTRRAMDRETPKKEWKLYKIFVKTMLDCGISRNLFKNQFMFLKKKKIIPKKIIDVK